MSRCLTLIHYKYPDINQGDSVTAPVTKSSLHGDRSHDKSQAALQSCPQSAVVHLQHTVRGLNREKIQNNIVRTIQAPV